MLDFLEEVLSRSLTTITAFRQIEFRSTGMSDEEALDAARQLDQVEDLRNALHLIRDRRDRRRQAGKIGGSQKSRSKTLANRRNASRPRKRAAE